MVQSIQYNYTTQYNDPIELLAESHIVEISPPPSAIYILEKLPESVTSLSEEINRINQHTARQTSYLSDYLDGQQQLIEIELQVLLL
jgi:hypothetical protein